MEDTPIPFAENKWHQLHKLVWICVQLVVMSYSAFLAHDRYLGLRQVVSSQKGSPRNANIVPQLFAIMATALSWLFIASALVVQIMAYENLQICDIATWICCTMYALAKVFLYMIMVEKVRLGHLTIVKNENEHASGFWPYYFDTVVLPKPRFDDTLYKCNWILLCLYPLILVDMLITKRAEIDEDTGRCLIGLPYISSLPLLAIDVVYTVWLTWLFYRALTAMKDPGLKRTARKNLNAAIVSMIFTELNLSSFVITASDLLPVHLCFGMCTLDIAANVTVVNWLMSSGNNRKAQTEKNMKKFGSLSSGQKRKSTKRNTIA